MDYIKLGKITNTHGLKGEIKILSDFSKKELVFKNGFNLYIGSQYQKQVINTYRVHQKYDMVTLKGKEKIEDVLEYKGQAVYIKREDLKLGKEILVNDLIGYKIVKGKKDFGEVIDIYKTKSSILLYVKSDKNYYIPYIEEFISSINKERKKIEVERVEELRWELIF